MQVDVFSFGVVIYELLIRQVTSAVVSQSGDASMPEMYANKVNFCCTLTLLPLLPLLTSCTPLNTITLKWTSCFHLPQKKTMSSCGNYTVPAVYVSHRHADKQVHIFLADSTCHKSMHHAPAYSLSTGVQHPQMYASY